MAEKTTTIGGFQVAEVTEIPEQVKKAKGIYAEVAAAAVEAAPKALALAVEEDKKAATRVQGLRGFLKRAHRENDFTVARQGSTIYVQFIGEAAAATPASAATKKASPRANN
jgi:7-keto-8-aminopelargonate synthetase-like enzyme